MEPFFFGKSPKQLFGIYHPPKGGITQDVGVVLCYPVGQEYIRSHRAFLRLAVMLSSAGFHVLRFDYYGCGDSEGDYSKGDIHQWISDISTAVDELKGGSGVGRIFLVGLRLGGSMAMMAGAGQENIDGVILWDPIINGGEHIEEIKKHHQEWLRGSFAKQKSDPGPDNSREILGFPLSDSLLENIKKIDLLSIKRIPVKMMLFIEGKEAAGDGRFREHMQNICAISSYKHLPGPEVWIKKDDEMSKGLVPFELLKYMVSWISEVRG